MILWREIQKLNFTSWKMLAEFLHLSSLQTKQIMQRPAFPLNIPRRIVEKMEKGTLDDPLFKQFVPLCDSLGIITGFEKDPVKDQAFCSSKKLLQKYAGRALLLCSSACAMHCRFCFRQNFPYEKERKDFEEELAILRADPSIKEIILSGGDPLSLNQDVLENLIYQLECIPHLKRLRFHTRFPIGIPERIDTAFLQLLERTRLQVWFVVHCNHPRELDNEILSALYALQRLRIPILTQTVLLKGINDSVAVLQTLFEMLVDHGIQPYYLHQIDKVEGAHIFEVPEKQAQLLMQTLRNQLSGYALPLYVKEIPGEKSKSPMLF